MEKARRDKGLEWCPEADLNHRHADFQSRAICGCSIASSENSVKPTPEKQTLSGDLSNQPSLIERAATWLVEHRTECIGRPIVALKERFGLRNLEAIEAAKLAHELEFGGRA